MGRIGDFFRSTIMDRTRSAETNASEKAEQAGGLDGRTVSVSTEQTEATKPKMQRCAQLTRAKKEEDRALEIGQRRRQ